MITKCSGFYANTPQPSNYNYGLQKNELYFQTCTNKMTGHFVGIFQIRKFQHEEVKPFF